MSSLPTDVIIISEAEKDAYLEAGYNPPPPSCDLELFYEEQEKVFLALRTTVSIFWQEGITDGDFFMSEDLDVDRLLCIEVGNERMLTPKLLKVVYEAISEFEPHYSVDICNAWTMLKTLDGYDYPNFNVFVERKRILVYTESAILFDKLGF